VLYCGQTNDDNDDNDDENARVKNAEFGNARKGKARDIASLLK